MASTSDQAQARQSIFAVRGLCQRCGKVKTAINPRTAFSFTYCPDCQGKRKRERLRREGRHHR